jgi:GNAT superfamily N-acetyltransferase
VADLTLRAFREYHPLLEPDFIDRYEKDIQEFHKATSVAHVLVAELGGRLAGTITLVTGSSPTGPHGWPSGCPVIRFLAVDPSRRGQGVGTLLATACVDRARMLGAAAIGLHTAPFMAGARRIYEALGFERAPAYDRAEPDSPPALAYRLPLGGPGTS